MTRAPSDPGKPIRLSDVTGDQPVKRQGKRRAVIGPQRHLTLNDLSDPKIRLLHPGKFLNDLYRR